VESEVGSEGFGELAGGAEIEDFTSSLQVQ